MTYLIFLVVLASAAILRLWIAQRRAQAHLSTVHNFQDSLEKISVRPVRLPRSVPSHGMRPPSRRGHAALEPERRAAAKRRIEARRRAMSASAR
ncbi:MAG: hypothetical protein ACR2KQ_05890 [Actinomycetota bacterium]